MTFKLSFGGTTFNLVVSSPEINSSLVSARFIPKSNYNNTIDHDAVIDLHQFTGKLFISHASNAATKEPKSVPCRNEIKPNNRSEIDKERRKIEINEAQILDPESAIARAKMRFKDFDEKLDRLYIINGEEWFGRLDSNYQTTSKENNFQLRKENENDNPEVKVSENYHERTEQATTYENTAFQEEGAVISQTNDDITDSDYFTRESLEMHLSTLTALPYNQHLHNDEVNLGSDIPELQLRQSSALKTIEKSYLSGHESTDAEGSNLKISTQSNTLTGAHSNRHGSLLPTCSTVVVGNLQNSGANSSNGPQLHPIHTNPNKYQTPIQESPSLTKLSEIEECLLFSADDTPINSRASRSLDTIEDYEDDDPISLPMSLASSLNAIDSKNLRRETRLHRACKNFKSKVNDLNSILKSAPKDASAADKNGYLPLHVIARNQHLLFGRETEGAQLFIDDLIKEYPDAILTKDDKGFIPFSSAINDWINDVHASCYETEYFFNSERAFKDTLIPKIVYADPLMEWSFKMLSEMFTHLENVFSQKMGPSSMSLARIHSPAQQFLEEMSCVSLLIKTCLLINEDSLRGRLLGYPFMKRLFLNDRMVGNWLVVLLANNNTSSRAIEYFDELSNLTASVALGISKPRVADIADFRTKLEGLIVEISEMDYILPALFLLNAQDMKRACSTYPVRRILELSMLDPSLLGLLVFDLCIHILLVISYHAEEHIFLPPAQVLSYKKLIFTTPVLLNIVICIYLFIREDGSHFVLIRSRAKKINSLSLWDITGVLAIFCVLGTNLSMLFSNKHIPVWIFMISKLLIWLKLVGFLKGINLHLTMFIESLGKIIFGMRWFLVVTLVTILMFADMMHIEFYYRSGFCEGDDIIDSSLTADYCEDSLIVNSLRAFSIFVGDVGLDDYRINPTVTLLWCIYMAVGVLMLLNVLIAIITDSYSNSFSKRFSLLGRARIPVLAKHSYLDTAARKLSEGGCTYKYCTVITGIIFFYILFAISFTAMMVGLSKHSNKNKKLLKGVSVAIFIIANFSLMIVVKDFFHINLGASESFLTKLIIGPTKPLVYGLCGISDKSEDFIAKEKELGKDDILPSVKEMIEKSELRIRREFNILYMKKNQLPN